MSYNNLLAKRLMGRYPLPYCVALKIVTQVERERERNQILESFQKIRRVMDGVHGLIAENRTNELVDICNRLYYIAEKALGDTNEMQDNRAIVWLNKQKWRKDVLSKLVVSQSLLGDS